MGVDLIVFGFSSVDRFHVEGVAEDEWNVLFNTEIGDPVPGEHAFYPRPRCPHGREQGYGENLPGLCGYFDEPGYCLQRR